MEGLISTQEEFKHIENIIRRAIKHPKGKEWFSGKYRLFNECTILFRQGEKHQQRRPDRVMVYGNEATVVDFKFGRENEEYIKQVQEYVRLLLQMGYENVKGYLWYIYSNKIIEI
ncbi:MAG: ATP-dependent helicase, partial [Bacteroidaceae bacterium]|nr:ATP-dependent helicase [Bacteroidaceae bacterium]